MDLEIVEIIRKNIIKIMGNYCSINTTKEMKSDIEFGIKLDDVELKYPVFYGVRGLRELSDSRKKIEK